MRGDSDEAYLLDLIEKGLWISEGGKHPKPFVVPNYRYVRANPEVMGRHIRTDVITGRVVQVQASNFINSLGLIPKGDSTEFRRITDLSRPKGGAINECMPDRHFSFQRLEDATSLMTTGCVFAIIDIRHAYRHVEIREEDWDLQSFTVGGKVYQDRCMSFGLKIAPEVFTRLTRAVCRILARMGLHNVMVYLDEFFICGQFDECWKTFTAILFVLADLGFYIHWGKIVLPRKMAKFLGFIFDSVKMQIRVPEDKLNKIKQILKDAVAAKWLPLKQWQSIAGKLNFMA